MAKKTNSNAAAPANTPENQDAPQQTAEVASTNSRIKHATGEKRQMRVVAIGANNKIVAQTKTLSSSQPDDEAGNKRILNFQRRQLITTFAKEIREAGGVEAVKFEIRPPLATEGAAS